MTLPRTPTRTELFLGFLSVGTYGFGGVLPWARRMIVESRKWLTAAEFNDLIAFAQFLPGPNVINLSVALGYRFHGMLGALACFAGLMFAPMAIIIGLGVLYAAIGQNALVQHALTGLAAGAAAMVIATALKIAASLGRRPFALAIAVVVFACAGLLRLPLLAVVGIGAPISILVLWRAEA